MELTNHTYLRSRVDMHIADSLRQKASSKIASGGMQNARDDSGGFTAAVRLKSNQYMLQSKRANIQNSLSFLQAQRDSLNASRDIMDKMGELKLKFGAPTINQSDKANINNEFKELAVQLAGLRQQKFNGQPLFAESDESSTELFGGSKLGLAVGTGTEGTDASVTKHGLDFQDIDSVYVAGEAVRRGIGGLDFVNFADEPVQKQVERVTVTGGIAEGDTFSFFLNEKSQVGETQTTSNNGIGGQGSPHLISYTATLADEDAADPHGAVVAGLKAIVDNLVGEPPEGGVDGTDGLKFVNAEIVSSPANTGILDIESSAAGDPFELFGATSTGSSGVLSIAETSGVGAVPAFTANDGEERTYELDLKDNDGNNSGYAIKQGDTITMTVDGSTVTYAPTQNEINSAPTDLSDPQNFTAAADFMLNGLMGKINDEADSTPAYKVRATAVDIVGENARIILKSTHRGDPLSGVSFSKNMTRAEQPATGSTVKLTKNERDAEANDTIRLLRNGTVVLNLTQDDSATNADSTKFSDFVDLNAKINAHADFTSVINGTSTEITITDANPDSIAGIRNPSDGDATDGFDRAQNVTLTVRQGQDHAAEDIGSVLAINATETLFDDKGDSFTNRATSKVAGTGDNTLKVDYNINKVTGVVTGGLAVSTAGTGYAINDQFTVAGTEMGDTDGNSITFNVTSVAGKASTASSAGAQKGRVASDNYTRTGISATGGTGASFALDITSQDDGTITKAQTSISAAGTGYTSGDTLSISAADLGGGNAVTGQITVITINGSGGIADFTWDSGSARSDNLATTYAVDTAKVGGDGDNNLKLNITTDTAGAITGATVAASGLGYAIGDTVEVTAAALGTTGTNRRFTVSGINGEVTGVSHASGQAQSNWSMTGTETGVTGDNLQIGVSAGRDGVITVDSINNNGSGYSEGATNSINLVAASGGLPNVSKNFNISDVKKQFTLAETTNLGSGGTTTTDAERGDQFIASGPLDTSFTEVAGVEQDNVEGENRVLTVEVNADKKIAGAGNDTDRIHVGDSFSITVTEVKHADELSGAWPESNTGTNTFGEQPNTRAAHSITASYTAIVGDDEDSVAAGLRQAYFTARTAYVATETLAEDDLPNAADTGNTITFTSGRKGEDFNVVWNQSPNPDVINATGAVNNPSGSASHIPNVSPFSITKSIDYFTEMLSQNGAETSRLMKAQEHLENTIVNTEHAWGKITDTDYARASTEQVRNSLKMQMASNIISKSIRMNDLLVDLTTKHHRGAMLNARA